MSSIDISNMQRVSIVPDSHEEWLALRDADTTSTEAAALFNLSPYETYFELWHRKKGLLQSNFVENERVVWGKRLEEAIAKGVAKDNNWTIRHMTEYMRIPEIRLGSSFDFEIIPDGLLEVKNVDSLQFKENWLFDDDGNFEAPIHIEFQVQQELAVSGRKFAILAALIGGNKIKLIRRERDETIIKAIVIKAIEFHTSLDKNEPPSPDFTKDAATISRLYQTVESGKLLEVGDSEEYKNLIEQYTFWGAEKKRAEEQQKSVKAQLLLKIGEAEKVVGDNFSISASMTKSSEVNYIRNAYRNFRVHTRKGK